MCSNVTLYASIAIPGTWSWAKRRSQQSSKFCTMVIWRVRSLQYFCIMNFSRPADDRRALPVRGTVVFSPNKDEKNATDKMHCKEIPSNQDHQHFCPSLSD